MLTMREQPKYVGGYRLGDTKQHFTVLMTKKPYLIHRLFMRYLLGWKWTEEIKEE